MNRIILLLLLSTLNVWSLEFYTYAKALQIQKKTDKVIMIDIMRTGCHFCKKMNKNVLQEKSMSDYIEKNFIPVRLNLDHDKLLDGMHVDFTPTFYFIDKRGKILKILSGSWTSEDFKFILKKLK
jgi:thioredoxin-related protein